MQYAYDSRGRLASTINARGNKIGYAYHTWGAIGSTSQYPTAVASTPTRTVAFNYDDDGNIASITDDAIQAGPIQATTYDALGRPLDETVSYIPGGDKVLQRRYDRFGNRRQLTLQDGAGSANNYVYDKLNRLISADLAGSAVGLTHFANDDRQGIMLPNGVQQALVYKPNGPLNPLP